MTGMTFDTEARGQEHDPSAESTLGWWCQGTVHAEGVRRQWGGVPTTCSERLATSERVTIDKKV